MSTSTKNKLNWSDALFSCVYLWVNGHPISKEDATAAMHQHKPDCSLGMLAVRMRSFVMGGEVTPEWLTSKGYLSSRDPDGAKEKRKAEIIAFVSSDELATVLSDGVRVNRIFPPIPTKRQLLDLRKLGDGTTVNEDDVEKLEELNRIYTHVLAFGDHHIASMRANPVTGETHAFQTLNSFRNNFLDIGRVAGRKLGEAWLQWPGHSKRLDGVGFYPNPSLCPTGVYNLFAGLALQPAEGDCMPYLQHLERVICAGNGEAYQYLISWLAHLFQKPEEKPSVAVVMKSIEGTGKGSMVRPLLDIFGMYGIQVNGPGQIAGRFNSTIANKLFVFIDEAELTDSRSADRLKAIISEPTINLERKGKDPEPMPNYARFIFASNHERVIRAGMRERRYLVLEPDSSQAQDRGYFDQLHQWINHGGAARLLDYLLSYDLSGFDPRRAPVTAALVEEKLASLPPVYQFIYSEIWEGKPFNSQDRVFASEMVSRFMTWSESHGEEVREASARSALGKVMPRLGMTVQGRSDRGKGRYYDVPAIEALRDSFAGLIGEEAVAVFDI
ncbi:primase-helicase family protein [Yersinia enterocolitica]